MQATKIFVALLFAFLISNCHAYIKSLYSAPLTLDPIKMNDTASLSAGNLIYDGLLKFSPTLDLEAGIADKWSTSIDGKTVVFQIRKNAKFHDGSLITSNDVVVSLRRALSKESKVRKFYDCIEDFKVIDNNHFQILLKFPFPPFLSILAGGTAKILPGKYVNRSDFFKSPIGSGAFKYVNNTTVSAFDQYYSGRPKLDKITLRIDSEASSIAGAMRGEIDDLSNWPLVASNPVFKIGKKYSAPVAATWIIGINSTKTPFNDAEIRRAFKNAIDADNFRQKFFPEAQTANGYIPAGLQGSTLKVKIKSQNIISKNPISIAMPQELANAQEIKQYFESTLNRKGWNVKVALLPWNALMKGYMHKKHQAFLVSMNMDYPDPEFLLRNFESSSPDNFSGLKNAQIDKLIEQGRSLQDRSQRVAIYLKALRLIEEEAVTIDLFYPRANYWVSKHVKGFTPNILSDVYIDYSKVSYTP